MGFISYSVKFFSQKLDLYESRYNGNAPGSVVHEAKVLLKFLDDIRDEGYENSYVQISTQCDAVNRLKNFILSNNDVPFTLEKYTIIPDITYDNDEYDLATYISLIEQKMVAPGAKLSTVPEIFYDILEYSKDIFRSFRYSTAYCFLLRDTLLPYLALKKWQNSGCSNVYPLFISRKYFSFFENEDGYIYSKIQNVIFESLEDNVESFGQLKEYVKTALNKELAPFSGLFDSLKRILDKVSQEKVLIIESGYIGTIPLLLSALDDRVDFRLFTTIPYFYEVYNGKFFTDQFEKVRLFETIQCQDALFKLSSISVKNADVSVVEAADKKVLDRSHVELRTWNRLINRFDHI